MKSYRNTNREHNRGLSQDSSKNPSRDPSPQKDQYAEIYRAQSKYAENLKRQERERSEKQRKKQEERERKKFLMSLQTNLDNSTPLSWAYYISIFSEKIIMPEKFSTIYAIIALTIICTCFGFAFQPVAQNYQKYRYDL